MRGIETFSINTSYDSTITSVYLKSCWQMFYTTDVNGVPGSWCLHNRMCVTIFFPIWACLEFMVSSRAEDPDTRVEGREFLLHRESMGAWA